MTQGDRVASNQDFLHQQSQNLLSHGDIERLRSYSQLAAKSRQALCQL
jgi:hypothetical protein